MKTRARLAAILISTMATAIPMTLGGATAASADNCEPTEPAVRVLFPNYEEQLLQDADNPLCYVLQGYVYPRICDDSRTLLGTCVRTLNPDLAEPVVVQPYQPDGGRIFCSVSNFVLVNAGQPASCTSSSSGESVLIQIGSVAQ